MYFLAAGSARKGLVDAAEWGLEGGAAGDGRNDPWAIGFNTAGIALATAGLLSPWLAALFHHISSVLVVLNSARLVRAQGTG